jgi:NADH-quinone oxidoreductase subunit E
MKATQTRNFAGVLAQIKPEAERLIAQYPQKQSALLPILHAFQNVEGWVSPEALATTGELLGLPLSVIESTASFYTLFFRRPVGRYVLQVCRNLSCQLRGAEEMMAYFREKLNVRHLETTYDGTFSYEEVECLAACDRAPCMQVNLEFVYDLTREKIDEMLRAMEGGTFETKPLPQSAKPDATWSIGQEAPKKSPGAQGVSNPNEPGGLDPSGEKTILRLVADPRIIESRPSAERLVRDGGALLERGAEDSWPS